MDDMPESAPGPLFPIEAQVEDAERWRQRYEDVEAKYEAGVVAENHLRDEVEALSNKIDELQQHVASAGWAQQGRASSPTRQGTVTSFKDIHPERIVRRSSFALRVACQELAKMAAEKT
ncbi:hypothetical protein DIPPA_31368 [Diplonema papillatum]|nr:hypothetical protein DIPPA_31368 [Diplonema papillatum]